MRRWKDDIKMVVTVIVSDCCLCAEDIIRPRNAYFASPNGRAV